MATGLEAVAVFSAIWATVEAFTKAAESTWKFAQKLKRARETITQLSEDTAMLAELLFCFHQALRKLDEISENALAEKLRNSRVESMIDVAGKKCLKQLKAMLKQLRPLQNGRKRNTFFQYWLARIRFKDGGEQIKTIYMIMDSVKLNAMFFMQTIDLQEMASKLRDLKTREEVVPSDLIAEIKFLTFKNGFLERQYQSLHDQYSTLQSQIKQPELFTLTTNIVAVAKEFLHQHAREDFVVGQLLRSRPHEISAFVEEISDCKDLNKADLPENYSPSSLAPILPTSGAAASIISSNGSINSSSTQQELYQATPPGIRGPGARYLRKAQDRRTCSERI